ncbi:MAG: hypothetical protein H8E57_05215 [Candidatus Cloacimonetes bacterium]|nr:hypothetical protein [Candidatus Cloacimonadota bacterium]
MRELNCSVSETEFDYVNGGGIAEQGEQSLIEEAKKYKSAEEYVASKGKPLFHGTNEKFDAFDISKFETMNKGDWGKGIYLEPSVRGAKYYRDLAVGYKNKEADAIYKKLEAMPQSDPNWSSVRREWLDALEKARSDKDAGAIVEAYLSKDAKVLNHNSVDGMTDATLAEQARKDGYDVIHIDKGRYTEEVVVLNPDVIKTKSQLTDIWNKAHEKPATAEVAFPDRFAI